MEILIKKLAQYVQLIKKNEFTILSFYGLEQPFYKNVGKIIKEGIIRDDTGEIDYKIHGAGCLFKHENGLIIDYDFISEMEMTINFSPWKFTVFLNSLEKEKTFSQEELLPYLEEMVNMKILIKHPDGFFLYGISEQFIIEQLKK